MKEEMSVLSPFSPFSIRNSVTVIIVSESDMSKWPIDDRLALMIGRVILAFANLDQQVYHAIQMLCATAGTLPVADDRFLHPFEVHAVIDMTHMINVGGQDPDRVMIGRGGHHSSW